MALLLTAAEPPGTPAETPNAWMERVYASYRAPDFSPFKHPDLYFAPALLAAIKEDSRLAKGEVGYLDGDPICQCQDAGGMRPRIIRVTRQSAGQASVQVLIDWVDSTARKARFTLVRSPQRVAHRRRRFGRRTEPAAGDPAVQPRSVIQRSEHPPEAPAPEFKQSSQS